MSDTNNRPNPDASLRGDTKGLPDRGTGTGWHGADPQLAGASVDPEATNSLGKITSATKSDPAAECYPDDPTFGAAKGDSDSGEYSA